VNFIDTAEMYSVPARKETYGATETIIGNWMQKNPGMRGKIVLATKVAGPSRGMPWVREGEGMTKQDIIDSCEGSLRRLKTDVIDLYQIHWPERNVPMFGGMYYDPTKERTQTSILQQLEAFDKLVKQGKIRYIGLSNETPYGVHEFVRLAEQHKLPRVQTVQNVYNLVSRGIDNGLDETMHRLNVSSIPYSPLAFGLLTGKYDESGIDGPATPRDARIGKFESVRKQRWGRPEALAAARRYNALARANGMTPTKMALAWCYTNWRVASTIIGVRTMAQLNEDLDAWGTKLTPEVLAEIDKIRWEIRDPAV
jgi:aryl-alcohol dehydrogenase-like predicted oxidoreductase